MNKAITLVTLIELYSRAADQFMQNLRVMRVLTPEQISDINWHGFLSDPVRMARHAYDALPEDMQTISAADLSATYMHNHRRKDTGDDGIKFEDYDLIAFECAVYKLHEHAYELYRELNEARDKFGLK